MSEKQNLQIENNDNELKLNKKDIHDNKKNQDNQKQQQQQQHYQHSNLKHCQSSSNHDNHKKVACKPIYIYIYIYIFMKIKKNYVNFNYNINFLHFLITFLLVFFLKNSFSFLNEYNYYYISN